KGAIEIPFRVMELCYESMDLLKAMAESGLEASASDVGVGVLCARTGVMGAYLNVKINAKSIEDKEYIINILKKGAEIQEKAIEREKEILEIVNNKMLYIKSGATTT
ncbi:MAG: cyclodeaminase/cyclohydrolase family protein, partial [Bacteroidia bacterium]|nr:cyclodeaminase/cyclohydrolase family protein [Bacteroidia bacterium]